MYDYLIVGSGFFGSICAYELNKMGYKVCVIDNRNHIGGNCHTENKDGINVHTYGPHIFHTSNEEVWKWINQFVEFNNFRLSPVANYKGELYSLPFNMWTFSKIYGITKPEEAKRFIENQNKQIDEPTNLEEQAIKFVGKEIYEKLIKGYTEKQWRKSAEQLPKEIIKRLPVRFTYDNNYFNDKYQGIPIGGYTQIFQKLLNGIDVRLQTDYFTDEQIPYTRIIEHKHFEFMNNDCTWITYEYPIQYNAQTTEPYYPVNDIINNEKYKLYKELADLEKNVIFGGRLAEYKYYDMHNVIESALNKIPIFITH